MSWFKDLSSKVQSSLPKFDATEMLEKLTLTTPELAAERRRIDAEEKRKERVRNSLAGMLPWETRDPERDILVDECKEAILQLSKEKANFFGPYQMPALAAKIIDEDEENDTTEVKEDSSNNPSKESLGKLAKLEPLPPLLRDFDFQAHVGLIEKILMEDPKLVQMQSKLSGGGERERVFWKNYFFHCAYTRYEAGLSIDEIWSDTLEESPPVAPTTQAAVEEPPNENEETITFENDGDVEATTEKADSKHPLKAEEKTTKSRPTTDESSESVDFEMVEEGNEQDVEGALGADDSPLDSDDYELDELEAEIARELEDD